MHLSKIPTACMIAALMAPTATRALDDALSVVSANPRLGAQVTTDELAFGLYAPHGAQVELLLFDHSDWRVLVRSWFGAGDDSCELRAWQTACPDVTDRIEIKGRSMAVLVSDND